MPPRVTVCGEDQCPVLPCLGRKTGQAVCGVKPSASGKASSEVPVAAVAKASQTKPDKSSEEVPCVDVRRSTGQGGVALSSPRVTDFGEDQCSASPCLGRKTGQPVGGVKPSASGKASSEVSVAAVAKTNRSEPGYSSEEVPCSDGVGHRLRLERGPWTELRSIDESSRGQPVPGLKIRKALQFSLGHHDALAVSPPRGGVPEERPSVWTGLMSRVCAPRYDRCRQLRQRRSVLQFMFHQTITERAVARIAQRKRRSPIQPSVTIVEETFGSRRSDGNTDGRRAEPHEWQAASRPARRVRPPEPGAASFLCANPFEVLASTDPGEGWWKEVHLVEKAKRVMDEMTWWHRRRWGNEEVFSSPLLEDPLTTDSAGVLKKAFMRSWVAHRPTLDRSFDPTISKCSALWNRIAFQRLRFKGDRRWYAVVRTADLQRRILVLHVPSGRGSPTAKARHAELQCTYRDTPADFFEPGIRVKPSLEAKVADPALKRILREGFRPTYVQEPRQRHGKNYGGVHEHADRVEAQLKSERGLFNEGPLHYTPHIVTDMNAIYYPEKDKLRLIWDCKKSGLNGCLADYGGPFDTLETALSHQTPGCWNSGWDLTDAFRLWALHHVDCDTIGIMSTATGEYDRVRYLPFGVKYSPEIQGRFMQALKPAWDEEIPTMSCTPAGSFKVPAVWVDDGHMWHDASLTQEQANAQFKAFTDWCETHGLDISQKKNIYPSKQKEYVGFVIDSVRQEVSLTQKRIDNYVEAIDQLLESRGGAAATPEPFTGGVRYLDLCGGIGTGHHALVEANFKVEKHWLVEVDATTRRMAENYSRLVGERFPHRAVSEDGGLDMSLPQDLTKITEADIIALGRVDIMTCAWPCQGLSRASRRGKGLKDHRSGLFWECLKILRWVQKHNPAVEFMFENVDFGRRHTKAMARDFKTVSHHLKVTPFIEDAGWVSGAHRVRSYWCSWPIWKDIKREGRPELQDLLDPDHVAPPAAHSDLPPMAPMNRRGKRRRCYPTVMKSADTYSVRNGSALVRNTRTGKHELPRVHELERIVGLLEGATQPPGVKEMDSRGALGNIIDRRMFSWILSNLRTAHHQHRFGDCPFVEVDRRELAEVVGKLQFTAKVVHGGQAHLSALYEGRDWFAEEKVTTLPAKQQWASGVKVRLTDMMVEELSWWKQALLKNPMRRYYCTGDVSTTGFWDGRTGSPQQELLHCSHTVEGIPVCRTDASGFGGGAEDGTETMMFHFLPGDSAPHRSSNWRELATVVRTVKHFREKWRGRRVLIMCDNSVSVSIVRRQGSQAKALNELYLELAAVCKEYDIDVALRHIKGVDNVLADALSRYERGMDLSDWRFSPEEFEWVASAVGRPQIDVCADPMGNNALCPRYYSVVDDCTRHSWTGHHIWCNGDYSQLERLLRHHKECKRRSPHSTSATFCVPTWTTKSWWRHLKGMEVVAYYPPGEHVFTAPDWRNLKKHGGGMTLGGERRDLGPTKWGVLILHDPNTPLPRKYRSEARSSSPPGLPRVGDVRQGDVHKLRGDAYQDALLLQDLRDGTLRRLSRDGPRAYRSSRRVLDMQDEGVVRGAVAAREEGGQDDEAPHAGRGEDGESVFAGVHRYGNPPSA